VPFAALLISDYATLQILWHGKYSWFDPSTWAAFSLASLLGWTLRDKITAPRVAGAAIGSAIVFFTVSNFGVWLGGHFYPKTFTGLVECYVAAIPFFRNDLAGNLAYSAVMFGSYHWITARQRAAQTA
jgi:hypothetical protein